MDLVETRELRYFVALAEELHFGRAAQRLGIAQPPLSRAVKQLERRLGVTLLERTSRAVRLTPAGEVLLHESRIALDAVAAAVRHTQRAGRTADQLVLVVKPGSDGGLLSEILTEYQSAPEALAVEIVFSIDERAAMLRDGRADIGLLHSPQNDLRGLDTEALLTERQVAVLPKEHPLAQRASLHLADLADETTPRWPGTSHGTGPMVHDSSELMQLIKLGRVVAVVPETVRDRLPDGLVHRPVVDAQPATLVVAWAEHNTSRDVARFVDAAGTAAQARHGTGSRRTSGAAG